MTTKLIPLSQLPSRARRAERAARQKYRTGAEALAAAENEIVDAEGTYSGAHPGTLGWLCSELASALITGEVCLMPGSTQHFLYSVRRHATEGK